MPNCNCQAPGFYRTRALFACAAAYLVLAVLGGCASPVRRAERIAQNHGLEPLLLQGTGFQHHAFVTVGRDSDPLVVFIDGDGSPWIDGGRRIAADPTPRVPLALELAAATPVSALYLGRPCYLEAARPAGCSERLWTSERYSAAVVASMSAAAATYIAAHHARRVLLVGFSGGGTLAVLMARTVPHTIGVVTLAGNLDPDAWTRLHGYLPLNGSLNPTLETPLPPTMKQWYLVGGRDTNVPGAATVRYFERVSPDRVWSYARFDHACCWVGEWPAIFAKVIAELNAGDAREPSH
jgi:hypothetical protein